MPRAFGTTNAAPYAVAPAVGAEGDMYFNTTSDTLWLSDGTKWIQVQGSIGGCGIFLGTLVGTTSPEVVTHNLGTRDVSVEVVSSATPYASIDVDWEATTLNTVTVRFAGSLAGYRINITGGLSSSTVPLLPGGGTTGQVLAKNSATDGDVSWQSAGTQAGYIYCDSSVDWLNSPLPPNSTRTVRWGAANPWKGFGQSGDGTEFTCQIAGIYLINATLSISATSGDAYVFAIIGRNRGGTYTYSYATNGEVPGWYNQVECVMMTDLQVGDKVIVQVGSSPYGTDNLGLDSRSKFTIVPVGGAQGPPGPTGPQGGIGIIAGGLATIQTSQTAITSTVQPGTQLTGAVCNVTTQVGRRYRITWEGNPYADVAGVYIVCTLMRDGVMIANAGMPHASAGLGYGRVMKLVDAPSAGAHTYSVGMYRSGGSGNINNYADTTCPSQLTVEDVGSTTP